MGGIRMVGGVRVGVGKPAKTGRVGWAGGTPPGLLSIRNTTGVGDAVGVGGATKTIVGVRVGSSGATITTSGVGVRALVGVGGEVIWAKTAFGAKMNAKKRKPANIKNTRNCFFMFSSKGTKNRMSEIILQKTSCFVGRVNPTLPPTLKSANVIIFLA
jgi:hypothetical protein